MGELDHKESCWCFWTVVLEKTLESPLDCKEIQPVNPKGYQSWIFIGRTDAEAETPILWPPDMKNWLIWKDPDAGKDWKREEKGMIEDEMVWWHPLLNALEVSPWSWRTFQFSRSIVSNLCDPMDCSMPGFPCPSPTPGVYSNSCPSIRWCHPSISSSVVPFSSCLQSFPASQSFPMSQFFISGGQSIGVSALTSALPMNIQDWFPLGLTGWISLQSKGLSRVFSNTTV